MAGRVQRLFLIRLFLIHAPFWIGQGSALAERDVAEGLPLKIVDDEIRYMEQELRLVQYNSGF